MQDTRQDTRQVTARESQTERTRRIQVALDELETATAAALKRMQAEFIARQETLDTLGFKYLHRPILETQNTQTPDADTDTDGSE